MNDAVQKLLAVVRSAWRFRWVALICAWIFAIAGWTAVLLMPGRYDTEARVYVDTSSLLRPLLEGLTVAPNTTNQIDLVKQALLGRPQLERVIDSTGLRALARTPADREAMVIELSKDIRFRGDLQSRNFSLTYSNADPRISYDVVRTLLGAFVDQSVQANVSDSASAQAFIERQLKEYELRLTESEGRLAEFKRQNIGAMPDDRGGYFERIQAELSELDRLGATMSVATHKRNQLRQRLLGGGSPGQGGGAATSSHDARIAEARTRLGELLLTYTEVHPDVLALKEAITALEAQRTVELQQLRDNVDVLGTPRSGTTNPVTQSLQIALNEVDVEIASLRAQVQDRQRRVAELRGSVNVLPQVEAELARLTRDYGTNRAQYDALLQRLESARLSEQAQKSSAVGIKVIDPPALPLRPAAPNRALLGFAVLMGALAVGGGIAWLMSQLRPVFLTSSELEARLPGIPVLGSIGIVTEPHVERRMRYVSIAYAVLGAGLALGFIGALLAFRWAEGLKLAASTAG
jgi:polysaccharide chain length determinant protein (PEP-CTERM system associated)